MSVDTVRVTRDALLAEVSDLEQRVAGWEHAAERARQRRSALSETIGDLVLDDPGAAESVTSEYTQAAVDLDVAERAIVAAGPRLERARRAVLEFDADEIEPRLAALRDQLAAHEAKTEKLLRALHRHEGEGDFVRTGTVQHEVKIATTPAGSGTRVWVNEKAKPWRSDVLRGQIQTLELEQAVLRDVAADRDPSARFHPFQDPTNSAAVLGIGREIRNVYEFYPASVRGPEALVEAPRYTPKLGW